MPTRKWFAATVVALGTIATAVIQAGGFDTTTEIALVGLVVQRVVAYLVPNDSEGPGDPDALPQVPVAVAPAADVGDKGSA
jgi:hypothetical protein